MNNFLFENGTKFLFGGGCVKEYLASFLRKYGPSVLLVTEEGERRSGAADEVRDILRRRGKQASECTVGPFCPRYDQVQQAARLCRERRVDLILGVGGSAVLDGCKAASLAAVCRGDLWENFGELQGVVDVPPLPVGFVASHLEAGAVNGASGLIHENQCVWRDYPPCDPRFALLDPARTCELPRRELLFQGFSALAGALEEHLTLTDSMSVSRELLETRAGETPDEANGWGILDHGVGSLEKVHVVNGRTVDVDMGQGTAYVYMAGKRYRLRGDVLTEED